MTPRAPSFQQTATTYRQGSLTLPREYYTDPAILEEETEQLFARQWNCVGRASRVEQPGEWFLATVAGDSLIVLRDRQGVLRAFLNVCRHRGTRLCEAAAGRFSESIQCPYHAWTYGTDGRLIGAPHMQDVEDFDPADYPLHQAAVAEWEGFLFVNLGADPVPFEAAWAPMLGRLSRFGLRELRVAHRVGYDVRANWKLVFQNYSECLHCPMIHPELAAVLPYRSGANDLVEGPFLGGYMEIMVPHRSATLSGRACGLPVSDSLSEEDRARGYYYSLKPNLLLSIHPDYVNYYLVQPVSPDRTTVESEWLFHPDNEGNPDFNPKDAIEFWDVTNRQDWHIVERSQLGISSRRYTPGPYSARESIPAAWDREYLRIMGR
ncbi:MAG TPA: aromatic ring-hydroxylating dioxygenase subunit alpha [Gemmatimonadales bacterium]|jgi:Rieske 2Fe-2S family protein|nr:aromatic ring-hydroxylating dioxygenase subunit alpha [Gemmatimonadales bacterium]